MRWLDVKYGTKEDRRQWLKLVGVKTNIVTSVEVSDGYAHDYPFYKGLVDRTAALCYESLLNLVAFSTYWPSGGGWRMYCSSCGAAMAQGLSYCNHCGAKLSDERNKSAAVKPEALVWGMVAVLVFGFAAIMFLMLAMKMVGFNVGQILAFTMLSFLIMLSVEGVFTWQFLRRKRSPQAAGDTALSNAQTTKELYEAQARVLPEHMPSVTEHTTRAFDPIYSERKSK